MPDADGGDRDGFASKAIANIIPKRLAHIRHNSTGFPPSPISDLHHRFREQDGILLRLHKSTAVQWRWQKAAICLIYRLLLGKKRTNTVRAGWGIKQH